MKQAAFAAACILGMGRHFFASPGFAIAAHQGTKSLAWTWSKNIDSG